jgi:hypothetical protein
MTEAFLFPDENELKNNETIFTCGFGGESTGEKQFEAVCLILLGRGLFVRTDRSALNE